jgi:hypothetical protein
MNNALSTAMKVRLLASILYFYSFGNMESVHAVAALSGLVSFRRTGRSLIYAAEYASMNELLAYLTENCCKGTADCGVDACDTTTTSRIEGSSRHETPARARSR